MRFTSAEGQYLRGGAIQSELEAESRERRMETADSTLGRDQWELLPRVEGGAVRSATAL